MENAAAWLTLYAMMTAEIFFPHDIATRAWILLVALALDAAIPPLPLWQRFPHPVAICGAAIGFATRLGNAKSRLTGRQRRMAGVAAILLLLILAAATGVAITAIASLPGGNTASIIVATLSVALLLASRSMDSHARDIATPLHQGDLVAARLALGKIVGRDTANLDEPAIAVAATESIAESLSDGIIAPALFYLLFGLPGICAYKMLNTADSMTGYKSPRYFAYGWGAARLDDLANLIPARLTAALIALTRPHDIRRIIAISLRDGSRHASPNSGWPMAAMAARLGIALGGVRQYGGRRVDSGRIHPEGRDANAKDILHALTIMWCAIIVFTVLIAITALLA